MSVKNCHRGPHIHKYENLRRKLYNCNANIYFTQKVSKKHFISNYAKIKVPNTSTTERSISNAHPCWAPHTLAQVHNPIAAELHCFEHCHRAPLELMLVLATKFCERDLVISNRHVVLLFYTKKEYNLKMANVETETCIR